MPRPLHHLLAVFLSPLAVAACGASATSPEATESQGQAFTPGDAPDTSCQVILRNTYIDFQGRAGPQTDCSSGTCWVVVTVTFDVAMQQSLDLAEAFVLYLGGASTTWSQAQAEPIFGAPVGFRRYQVVLNANTFTYGPNGASLQLIPFITSYESGQGQRLFDHNRVADPGGAYQLTADNNWTISDDAVACPGAQPAGTLALTFPTGWNNSSTGTLVGGGKLDVSYDVYRIPQTLSCTTDGVNAFSTSGHVRFQPSGTVLSEVVTGPTNSTTLRVESLPLEFDVPAGSTSASLWFSSSSDCTGGTQWDSDYGQNYNYNAN